jgi:pimeloyl-ACP methyl ester carboxylesterase
MTTRNDEGSAGRTSRIVLHGGMTIAADAWGDPSAQPVLLLHGGGQTRYAWGGTARALARAGFHAMALDLRGHGESDWCARGEYHPDAYATDVLEVVRSFGGRRPALVGASLGGMISLLIAGEIDPSVVGALVLVDVTPRLEPEGVDRIFRFMTAHPDGFDSIEAAAAAVAEFLPHRPRPPDPKGLEKNLRRGADGRYRWHWDPKFLTRAVESRRRAESPWPNRLDHAARHVACPTLLVRGKLSDVVSEEAVKQFRALTPHAEYVDVADAAHMVAGDRNDVFADAVIEFLSRVLLRATEHSSA